MVADKSFQVVNVLIVSAEELDFFVITLTDIPYFVVFFLRLLKELGQRVDLLNHEVGESAVVGIGVSLGHRLRKPFVLTHAGEPHFHHRVAIAHVDHELLAHVAFPRRVVKRDIVVPQRSEVEGRVVAVFVEVSTVEAVGISRNFVGQIPGEKAGGVDVTAITQFGVAKLLAVEAILKTGNIVLDIFQLAAADGVARFVNAHHHIVRRGDVRVVAVVIARSFEQVSSAHVGSVVGHLIDLLVDVDPLRTDVNLVRYLVSSLVFIVQVEVHKFGGRIKLQSQEGSHLRSQCIPDHGFVGAVGQQCPAACLRVVAAQQALLLLQFDAIGLLGHAPRGVSASANLDGIINGRTLFVHPHQAGVDIVLLTRNAGPAIRVDVNAGQVGKLSVFLGEGRRGDEQPSE